MEDPFCLATEWRLDSAVLSKALQDSPPRQALNTCDAHAHDATPSNTHPLNGSVTSASTQHNSQQRTFFEVGHEKTKADKTGRFIALDRLQKKTKRNQQQPRGHTLIRYEALQPFAARNAGPAGAGGGGGIGDTDRLPFSPTFLLRATHFFYTLFSLFYTSPERAFRLQNKLHARTGSYILQGIIIHIHTRPVVLLRVRKKMGNGRRKMDHML